MLYGEKYTEENVARLSKRLDEADVDICFLDDPAEPFLLWKMKINQNPSSSIDVNILCKPLLLKLLRF
ncbi:uncharacterized protein B0P05DRAFT_632571 [Gilbertella persicaria]|uniref:uncharacterized protein n=1 Tax=Gilbertella persicaria TaxID=101096 RepID=UPI002220E64C|nr:uncharacterized protein B0P05DRAFT_632571 [Gilbertella persicaria]KAI8047165.1 hypothetical protein B0P05DRAFT_632571 [Gilbertella persicaria]